MFSNVRVTEVGKEYDTHHVMLDFGTMPFPVLEGQSIGVIPPGTDATGRPHHARQYSIASPRNGERPGYNNLSLAIKRVLEDHQGRPVRGVGSNYMCDLQVGDKVQVIGPFGASFLMPNHAGSSLVMICTGTGSAPMRAMTEWRRRLRQSGKFEGGKLMLFFGARTQQELPYFGPLQNLPKDFIDINFAFSRTAAVLRSLFACPPFLPSSCAALLTMFASVCWCSYHSSKALCFCQAARRLTRRSTRTGA